MPKDDILTLKLPGANLVFTRYLYIKDEVKTALLLSILNKSDDAIFWAYELYYSGFKNELYALIWKIYYDFFATLNPSFSVYLSKKFSNKDMIEDRLISSIIQNLIIRAFNTDVFLLRTISELFEADAEESVSLECRLDNKDYRGLAQDILNNKELDEVDTYQRVLNYYKLTNQQKLMKDLIAEIKTNSATTKSSLILVANILSLINKLKDQSQRKNFYVRVDTEEVVQSECCYWTRSSRDKSQLFCSRGICYMSNIDTCRWCGLRYAPCWNSPADLQQCCIPLQNTCNDPWCQSLSVC